MRTKGKIIHNRKIDLKTYEGASDSIIVEGVLYDERLVETYFLAGDLHPPGAIHHMIIRMEVKGPKLIIYDIEVEMPTIPNEACVETQDCLNQFKGLPIVAGFTAKVKDLIGGRKGCCHLSALLISMAPAAVQGAWSAVTQEPVDEKTYLDVAFQRIKNTCWVWREEGPLIKEWKDKAQSQTIAK